MRRAVWSSDALDDLDDMIGFIGQNSHLAADVVLDRIESAAQMPAGRMGRVVGTHEWTVRRTSYSVASPVTENSLTIVRVVHGATDWPDDAWPADA